MSAVNELFQLLRRSLKETETVNSMQSLSYDVSFDHVFNDTTNVTDNKGGRIDQYVAHLRRNQLLEELTVAYLERLSGDGNHPNVPLLQKALANFRSQGTKDAGTKGPTDTDDKSIPSLVADGELGLAIERLLEKAAGTHHHNSAIMLSGRYRRLTKDVDMGTTTQENIKISEARISQAVISLASELP